MRSYTDRLCRIMLACGVMALCLSGQAGAVTVILEPSQDNTLYEDSTGATSNGAGEYFFVGRVGARGGQTLRRGLIKFDVASLIPPGAMINSVELSLNASSQRGTSNGTIALHPVLTPWGEGLSDALGAEGGGAAPTAGDATWLHTHFDIAFWTNPGGDFDPAPSGSVVVTGNGPQVIVSTLEMVADVQAWLDDPVSNHGWLIRQADEAASAIRFDSRENLTSNVRPRLTIDYSLPPLLISPRSGIFAATQVMDVVLFVNPPPERLITDAQAFLDEVDVSADYGPCFFSMIGSVPEGVRTFRCPNRRAADLGAGQHTLRVVVILDDATSLEQTVIWSILPNTEP